MNKLISDHSDGELIARTLGGQPEAFGELVLRYEQRLFNSMVQMLRSQADAEDVVQDALLLAYRKLSTFEQKSGFYTWLFRITYNVAVTRIRRRRPEVGYQTQAGSDTLQLPDQSPTPESALIERERAEQLLAALGRLSDEHRSILILREMESMDYAEIAAVLDVPLGTVRSRIHRARWQLKEILEGMFERERE